MPRKSPINIFLDAVRAWDKLTEPLRRTSAHFRLVWYRYSSCALNDKIAFTYIWKSRKIKMPVDNKLV